MPYTIHSNSNHTLHEVKLSGQLSGEELRNVISACFELVHAQPAYFILDLSAATFPPELLHWDGIHRLSAHANMVWMGVVRPSVVARLVMHIRTNQKMQVFQQYQSALDFVTGEINSAKVLM